MNCFQAPPPQTNNRDEAFLNLLSSQRVLLNQLNQESAERKVLAAFGGDSHPSTMVMGGHPYHHADSFSNISPNRSIASLCEPSMQDTVVQAKRFSMGFGGTDMLAPSSFTFGDDSFTKLGTNLGGLDASCDFDLQLNNMTGNKPKRDKADDFELEDVTSFHKKRRFSGPGLFNSLSLFVEHSEQQKQFHQVMQRGLSMSPSLADQMQIPDDNFHPEEEEDFFQVIGVGPAMEPQLPVQFHVVSPAPEVHRPKPKKAQPQPLLTGDPKETRQTMLSLSSAMEKSQKSQQDIHDWDRKMGLKKSHSKTMRLSMRSRKKLRAMLKKHVNTLASKKR